MLRGTSQTASNLKCCGTGNLDLLVRRLTSDAEDVCGCLGRGSPAASPLAADTGPSRRDAAKEMVSLETAAAAGHFQSVGKHNHGDQRVQRIHLTVGLQKLCIGVLCARAHTHTIVQMFPWVSKYGCEEVDEHSQDGHVAGVLHSSPGGSKAEIYQV